MSKKKKGGFFKFLAGLGIGAAAGVLLTPKTGAESRKELKAKLDDLVKKAKEIDADEVKEAIATKVVEIQDALADLDEEKALKIAKEKANNIKDLAVELYNYAVDKGTPLLKEAAEVAKDKAIDVTKEVLAKLEEK